jgi:2,3-bisphosphoglycerate-independent phosphoglycerate mutase
MLIPDGAADRPLFDGKTPLELAKTPNLDSLAKEGLLGLVRTIPPGFPPGSDIGIMTLLGYHPAQYYMGRAPLEIASKGIKVPKDATVFRMNLVTVSDDGIMLDHSGGQISDEEAASIVKLLKELESENIKFYTGKSYRNFMVVKGVTELELKTLQTTPPHDILGKKIDEYLPKGADFLRELMFKSREILKNQKANMVWFWGEGRTYSLPPFKKLFGKRGAIISAVDLVKGIGTLAGLRTPDVKGATGYLDSNFEGKVDTALDMLHNRSFVAIHIEAPDETSHEGSLEKKIEAIETFDSRVLGRFLEKIPKSYDFSLLVVVDHRTPLDIRTHSDEPTPFLIYRYRKSKKNVKRRFCERDAQNSGFSVFGTELLNLFFFGKP